MTVKVWIFSDLPLGRAVGPSYMLESWQRELDHLGIPSRTFTPSTGLRSRNRGPCAVTFRTLRHIAYTGDYHARFSALAEVLRARRNRPQVILVATLGRVGMLGLILAAVYSIPLVLVVSTDTTVAAGFYSAPRVLSSIGVKPAVLLLVSRRIRGAFFRSSEHLRQELTGWSRRLAAHAAAAAHAQAREIVLLSPKNLAHYGRGPQGAPVTIFPAGVDRLPACPPPPELVWRPGALRLLYVGRLAPEKKVPILVETVRAATEAGLDVDLTLVGEGPLREQLLEQAQRHGVADRVRAIGPFPRQELGGIYADADVFVFPSQFDTQGFVLNEAAHEGLPLLVCDTANSVVEDGVSAIVVPADPHHLAEALTRLQDRGLRERLGAAARARAAEVGEAAQSARLAQVLYRAADRPFSLLPDRGTTGGTAGAQVTLPGSGPDPRAVGLPVTTVTPVTALGPTAPAPVTSSSTAP